MKLKASMIDVRDSQSPNHLWRLCTAPGEDPWTTKIGLGNLCRNLILAQVSERGSLACSLNCCGFGRAGSAPQLTFARRRASRPQYPRRKMKACFQSWRQAVLQVRAARDKAAAVLSRMELGRTMDRLHTAFRCAAAPRVPRALVCRDAGLADTSRPKCPFLVLASVASLFLRFWYRWSMVKLSERLMISPPLFRPQLEVWDRWLWEHMRSRELHTRIAQLHRGFRMRHCFQFWHGFAARNRRVHPRVTAAAVASCFGRWLCTR